MITVHFEQDGVPICLLLDVVEVARSHSGINLANAFADVLKDYEIEDKVRYGTRLFEETAQYLLCVHRPQILSVTCDNASANDAMIDHLAKVLPAFPGAANRTRCFTHILNLVAKCIMKQFDSPKSRKGAKPDRDVASESDDEEFEDLAAALDELEDELEDEGEMEVGLEKMDDKVIEEMLDERKGMTAKEIRALERSVKPVRLVLTKVCRLSNVCR